MTGWDTVQTLLNYSDWANGCLLKAASPLSDAQLDQPIDMGMGSLRRTLLHILAGEAVWLQRWKEQTETKWPDETLKTPVGKIAEQFESVSRERDAFLRATPESNWNRDVTYRDSKGSLFHAKLGDMMLQMCLHSHYHRAQAVNMLRRVAGHAPELDYMMWVRKPA